MIHRGKIGFADDFFGGAVAVALGAPAEFPSSREFPRQVSSRVSASALAAYALLRRVGNEHLRP
jgi:hypothetical protein